jgi:hypothetical protein
METRVAAVINMQTEIFATLDQINRDCFDRAKSDARLASELSAKLTERRWMGLADEAQSTADAAGVLPNPVDAERPRSSAPRISTIPSHLTG